MEHDPSEIIEALKAHKKELEQLIGDLDAQVSGYRGALIGPVLAGQRQDAFKHELTIFEKRFEKYLA